jgi:hypothetical protein
MAKPMLYSYRLGHGIMVTGGYKDNTLLLYIATGDERMRVLHGERAAADALFAIRPARHVSVFPRVVP